MSNLGVMLDCSRNAVMKPDKLKLFVDCLAKMGYSMLQLYTEDTYEIPEEPYFGYMRGRYSIAELQDLDSYCKTKGIELVPCIQVLAHLNQVSRWEAYRGYFDCFDILLAEEEKTYELIDHMFSAMEKAFSSRRANIGMDEAHFIGLGEYLKRHGFQERSGILVRHLTRVRDIAAKHGFSLMLWSDMFMRLATGGRYYDPDAPISQEVLDTVPKDVELVYWDYYNIESSMYDNMLSLHEKFPNDTGFAGGGWTWSGFCPSLKYAERVTEAAMCGIKKHHCRDIFITLWGDDGGECPGFSALPVLWNFAARAMGEDNPDTIASQFEKMFHLSYSDFMKLELPNYYGSHFMKSDNSAKVFLYNDPFLGLMDLHIPEDAKSWYQKAAADLKTLAKQDGPFSCLFRTAEKLSEALEIKTSLGWKTRKAYQEKDREAMIQLVSETYPETIRRVEAFILAFREQWEEINKPFGLEVQDIRMGGLLQRLEHCQTRLEAWLSGREENIPELEETLLDYAPGWKPENGLETRHRNMVTACVMSH